jgi:hypothetical protein
MSFWLGSQRSTRRVDTHTPRLDLPELRVRSVEAGLTLPTLFTSL